MIVALDHIAIAVPNLQAAIVRFAEDFGFDLQGVEDVTSAQASTAMFPMTEATLELVSPLNGEGPLAKYLANKPGGLHHICFRSDDLDADVDRLRRKGYRFIQEKPMAGADGKQVIFIHPKSCDGVLIELSQIAKVMPDSAASHRGLST